MDEPRDDSHPTNDLLNEVPLPRAGVALRRSIERIMARWNDAVREMLPVTDSLSYLQLRDHLPPILAQIATAISSVGPKAVDALEQLTQDHGELRFEQDYDIREIFLEYRLLRRIVAEEVSVEVGGPLTLDEVIQLDMGLDIAIQEGMVALVARQKAELAIANATERKYLAYLSHDLKNDLAAALTSLEYLGQSDEVLAAPGAAKKIQLIDQTLRGTMRGMERLLEAERFRHGQVKVVRTPVDLRALIATVTAEFEAVARAKRIALTTSLADPLVVRTDREIVRLVLHNLVGNAVKFCPGAAVRVDASCDAAGGWTLAVVDAGPGIAEEKRERIFDAFVRGDVNHGQSGIGLGLAIASDAARTLGGTLTLTSQLNVGSTFALVVPAAVSP